MDSYAIYTIFLGLASAKVFEFVFSRVKIPSLIAWFVAGIIMGPHLLSLINRCPELELFSRIATIFLMFYIGFSTNYSAILRKVSLSIIVGIAGVTITFLLCFAVLYSITTNLYSSILVSIILSNTASEIVSSMMLTINNFFIYDIVMTASIVDDIIAVIAVAMMSSIFLNITANYFSYILLSITMIASSIIVGLFSQYIKKTHRLLQREIIHTLTLTILGLSITVTIWTGINELLIAYIIGLMLNIVLIRGDALLRTDTVAMDLTEFLNKLLHLLFLPLLFIYIALSIEIEMININMFLMLLIASTLGKLIGCSLPAFLKTRRRDSIFIGLIMMLRGTLENTLLNMLYLHNLVDKMMYSTSTIVPFISTLLSLALFYGLRASKALK